MYFKALTLLMLSISLSDARNIATTDSPFQTTQTEPSSTPADILRFNIVLDTSSLLNTLFNNLEERDTQEATKEEKAVENILTNVVELITVGDKKENSMDEVASRVANIFTNIFSVFTFDTETASAKKDISGSNEVAATLSESDNSPTDADETVGVETIFAKDALSPSEQDPVTGTPNAEDNLTSEEKSAVLFKNLFKLFVNVVKQIISDDEDESRQH